MPQQDIFVDAVGGIAVTGTLVRLDLLSLTEPGSKDSQPKFQSNQRLVMPLDGFVRLFGAAESVMKQLVDAGVVTMNKPQDDAPSAKAKAKTKASASATINETAPASPNFSN